MRSRSVNSDKETFQEIRENLRNNTIQMLVVPHNFNYKKLGDDLISALTENTSLTSLSFTGIDYTYSKKVIRALYLDPNKTLTKLVIERAALTPTDVWNLLGILNTNSSLRHLEISSIHHPPQSPPLVMQLSHQYIDHADKFFLNLLEATSLIHLKIIFCRKINLKWRDVKTVILERNTFLHTLSQSTDWINNSDTVFKLMAFAYMVPAVSVFDLMWTVCKENPLLIKKALEKYKGELVLGKLDLLTYIVRLAQCHRKEKTLGPIISYLAHEALISRDLVNKIKKESNQPLMEFAAERKGLEKEIPCPDLLIYLQSPAECALERHLFANGGVLSQIAYGNLSIPRDAKFIEWLLNKIEKVVSHRSDEDRHPCISLYYYKKLTNLYNTLSHQVSVGKRAKEFCNDCVVYSMPPKQETSIITNLKMTFIKIEKQLGHLTEEKLAGKVGMSRGSTAVEQGVFGQVKTKGGDKKKGSVKIEYEQNLAKSITPNFKPIQ